MKIVLDTNCLVVVLPKSSPYRKIWNSFRKGKFTLCFTTEILNEYIEILTNFYGSNQLANNVIDEIMNSKNIQKVEVFYKWNLITSDPDDNKFVDCGISCNAEYIVTNDHHFKILKNIDFPKINCIDIEKFKAML